MASGDSIPSPLISRAGHLRRALDAIEAAINRDDKGDARAILQNARDALTAVPEPGPSMRKRRTRIGDDLNEAGSLVYVAKVALRAQTSDDIDDDLAVLLGMAYERILSVQEEMSQRPSS